jgi:hypothetical protein
LTAVLAISSISASLAFEDTVAGYGKEDCIVNAFNAMVSVISYPHHSEGPRLTSMIGKLLQDSVGSFDTLFVLLELVLSLRNISERSSRGRGLEAHQKLFEQLCLFIRQLPMLGLSCHPVYSFFWVMGLGYKGGCTLDYRQ